MMFRKRPRARIACCSFRPGQTSTTCSARSRAAASGSGGGTGSSASTSASVRTAAAGADGGRRLVPVERRFRFDVSGEQLFDVVAGRAMAAARILPVAAAPVTSVTTRKGARASASVASSVAARPLARRKRPGAPACWATRSGKARASRRPASRSSAPGGRGLAAPAAGQVRARRRRGAAVGAEARQTVGEIGVVAAEAALGDQHGESRRGALDPRRGGSCGRGADGAGAWPAPCPRW